MPPAMFTSALRYKNPEAAIAWLETAFGFRRHFVARAGDAEGSPVVHAQMKLDEAMVFLGPDSPGDVYGMHSPLELNGTNQCICIAVDDVEGFFTRARNGGATIVTEPHDTPYGAREFACKDLEGHVWSIGNYRGEP